MPAYSNVVTAPSGKHQFVQPDYKQDAAKPVVQVLQIVKGGIVVPTPAQHYADTIADMRDGANLAIDYGQDWYLGTEDTAAYIDYARDILNKHLADFLD